MVFFGLSIARNELMTYIGVLILFIVIVTYTLTAVVNPGLPDRNLKKSLQENTKQLTSAEYCHKCKVLKNDTTIHCDECEVCIEGHDHHCAWVGTCIGRGNLIYFRAFLGSTFFLVLHIIASVLIPIG